MKQFTLNYYPNFNCIADKCKHSCCIGWEINIDSDSLERYKNENSTFSKALICGIDLKKSKFKTDKNKKCAFLNEKGLCELIIHLGENSLCQVCRDHPRFRTFFNDRVEMGLGFCCEEATKIILSFEDKIEPTLIADDKRDFPLDFNQKNIIDFREKALNILQNRKIEINERVENLLSFCNLSFLEKDFNKIVKTFLSFERLDKSWTKRLKSIKNISFNKNTDESLSLICEQFLVNSLYRHLYDAEDTIAVRARTVACIFSWWIIKSILNEESPANIFDIVRAYSSEVEYSEKNLNNLYNFSYKFIKI